VRRTGALRHPELVLAAIICAIVAVSSPRLPQPLDYHQFADTRTFLGVPNALNVLSNVPFALVGIAGLIAAMRSRVFGAPIERWSYVVLFVGVALTAFGSSWYHLAPDLRRRTHRQRAHAQAPRRRRGRRVRRRDACGTRA
jgi:hypothetical protein